MLTRALAKAVYALFGTVYLVAGASVLLLGSGLLPAQVRDVIVDVGQDQPNTLHVMQEFASLLVFAGLMTFWFLWRYDDSRAFHWAMTVFLALFALVHFIDIRGSFRLDAGAAITAIPFGIFLAVGLLRVWLEAKGK
jgi:hypothetical protein